METLTRERQKDRTDEEERALEERAQKLVDSQLSGLNKTPRKPKAKASEARLGGGMVTVGKQVLVDSKGGGDFLEVSSAVSAAKDGDVINIMPGTYKGNFRVSCQLSLVGRPNMQHGSVILEHKGREPLLAAIGPDAALKIEQLILRHRGFKNNYEHSALLVEGGASVGIVGTGLTCTDANCIMVRGHGSKLSLKSCQVYDGGRCGIELLSGATLTAEATKVSGNGWSGIEVSQGAAASLQRCVVTKNKMFGVHFKASSSGLLDKNTVNAHSAIYGDIKIDPEAKVEDTNRE